MIQSAPHPASLLETLAHWDTPTICNALEVVAPERRLIGYTTKPLVCPFPDLPPMVGYAVTSTFRSMAPPRSGDVYAGLDTQAAAFAEAPGPPVVVYQDLDEPTISATFGEVMCSVYKAFGARGIITSGAGRDLDQVEALQFPAFTNGTICAHGYCHTPQVNVPVTVGGLWIQPGDLLHGDRNGVTTIPHEIASEIADACEELMAAEQIVLDYLKSDGLTPAGLAGARKECGARIAALAKRLVG